MKIVENEILLKILIGEEDKFEGVPVYKKVMEIAKNLDISGITITRGITGFGAHKHLHTFSVLSLSENLPLIIEIIEKREKIELIEKELDNILEEGLITKHDVEVIRYKKDN